MMPALSCVHLKRIRKGLERVWLQDQLGAGVHNGFDKTHKMQPGHTLSVICTLVNRLVSS